MHKIFLTKITLALAVVAVCTTSFAYESGKSLCERLPRSETLRYGRFISVPFDYSKPDGPTTNIHFFTLKPYDPQKQTLVFLPGGPGDSVHPQAVMHQTAPMRAFFDSLGVNVVYLDQRGTACSQAPTQAMQEQATQYTSETFIQDLEQVRIALGLAKISVWGFSYGTRPAAVYASRYPHRVNVLMLNSAVTPRRTDGSLIAQKNREHQLKVINQILASVPDWLKTEIARRNDPRLEDWVQLHWSFWIQILGWRPEYQRHFDYQIFKAFQTWSFITGNKVDLDKQEDWKNNEMEHAINYVDDLTDRLPKELNDTSKVFLQGVHCLEDYPLKITMATYIVRNGKYEVQTTLEKDNQCGNLQGPDHEYMIPEISVPTIYLHGQKDIQTPIPGVKEHFDHTHRGSAIFFELVPAGHNVLSQLITPNFSGYLSQPISQTGQNLAALIGRALQTGQLPSHAEVRPLESSDLKIYSKTP